MQSISVISELDQIKQHLFLARVKLTLLCAFDKSQDVLTDAPLNSPSSENASLSDSLKAAPAAELPVPRPAPTQEVELLTLIGQLAFFGVVLGVVSD